MTTSLAARPAVTPDGEVLPVAMPTFNVVEAIPRMIEHQRAMAQMVKSAMTEGHDYGLVPGTKKPSLFQPGADKMLLVFGLHAVPRQVAATMTAEFVSKTYTVSIYHTASGALLASCSGSCNSAEDRFYRKSNGHRMPVFTDARECENTIDKMAQKRAKVGAALMALAIADIFTQDVEDLPPEQLGVHTAAPAHATAGGGSTTASRPASDKPAGDRKVPFGRSKGKMLKELTPEELASMRDWCEEKDAAKFADLIAACNEVLTQKGIATGPVPEPTEPQPTAPTTPLGADPTEVWEQVSKQLAEDDLPF